MRSISLEESTDGWVVITDEETGVTTQGETKREALLMLADALTAYEQSHEPHTDDDSELTDTTNEELLEAALDIFVADPNDLAAISPHISRPDIPSDQVHRQREAAFLLARSHRTIDYRSPEPLAQLLNIILTD